jgi:hypothetical protein
MHETKIVYLSIGGGGTVRRCQGCSVFGMEKYGDPPSTVRAHGYAAGRIEFGENDGTLRLWPRIATSKTGRWRFIPDHENAELHDDEATKPETFAVRTITVLGPVSRKQRDHGSDFIKIPRSSWPDELAKKDMPDSMLLRPESRVVRFHRLREPLRDTIVNWAITPDSPVKLRLQAGEGGAGKTRLLIEVCHQLEQSHGWRAGFVERSQSSASGMSELLKEGKPSLIVLDYAESRTSEIVEITKVALRTPNAPPARLVLLAREGGDWWDRLADGAGSDQAVSAILRGHVSKTGPYRMTGERIKRYARGTIFAEALHDFAVSKGVAPPSISPPDLSDDLFGNPLFIHLSALSHLRGQPSIDDKELLGMALGHERSYWWQLLSENGLLALQPVLEQAVALFTLCGGKRTAKEARAVLSRRVVDILRTKLPGTTLNLVNLSIEIRRQAVAFLEKKKMGSPTKRPRSMVLLGLCALRRAGTGCEPAPSCRHPEHRDVTPPSPSLVLDSRQSMLRDTISRRSRKAPLALGGVRPVRPCSPSTGWTCPQSARR